MKNILFRADSSSTIGTGHIMRDLVLAGQFKDANIIFATQALPGNINQKIEEKNYTIKILDSNSIEEVIELINKYAIDMIVIDSYDINYRYEKELKEKTNITIFVFDDTYEKHYCDILLNHNVSADETRYKGLVPKRCNLRCGTKYTLLRDEFIEEKQKKRILATNNHSKNVFIAMGGADHANKNIEILKVLEKIPNVYANIVTTTANQYLADLKVHVKNQKNITLHINTDKIAKLMSEADFAIVTPSVTLNEIIYMKLPFIAIRTADNQNDMYKYLFRNNYLVLEKFNSDELKNNIEKLIDSLSIELINFIDLSLDDQKIVLEWRNHPNIRKWMFTQDKIALNDHLNYVKSLKTRHDRLYFLVKKENQSIGIIDFTKIDQKNKTAAFGIYAKPNLRGIGNTLMKLIIDYAFRILGVETLVSEVFEENVAAIKLYNRYNFKKVSRKKLNEQRLICMELKR